MFVLLVKEVLSSAIEWIKARTPCDSVPNPVLAGRQTVCFNRPSTKGFWCSTGYQGSTALPPMNELRSPLTSPSSGFFNEIIQMFAKVNSISHEIIDL